MKIVIVMTYYERQFQLNKTLLSLLNSEHKDFEVVIVDDASPSDILLSKLPYSATVIKIKDKKWTNPEPAYNIGIAEAIRRGAEIVILQNAECYHVGDVISYAERVTPESYISFGAYSIDSEVTFGNQNIHDVISANNFGAVANGTNSWYNHPQHRPVGYDFCAAITVENIKKLNGYDERLSDGYSYGDDYLIARILMMGLKVEITESPFVVHQWHYNGLGVPENSGELMSNNRNKYFEILKDQNVRAIHKYTEDL